MPLQDYHAASAGVISCLSIAILSTTRVSTGSCKISASVDRQSARDFAFDSTFADCQGVIMLNQNSKLSNNDIISSSEPAFPSTVITPFSIRMAGGLPSNARAMSPCRVSVTVASASGLCVALPHRSGKNFATGRTLTDNQAVQVHRPAACAPLYCRDRQIPRD